MVRSGLEQLVQTMLYQIVMGCYGVVLGSLEWESAFSVSFYILQCILVTSFYEITRLICNFPIPVSVIWIIIHC